MTSMHDQLTWMAAGLDEVPDDPSWIDPLFAARIDRLTYTKRRSETMLSRWVAKCTIARSFGMPVDLTTLSRIEVGNAIDGAPEAAVDNDPLRAVIAMTDRADWAVCMVLAGSGRVGCDLELVEPRSPAFVEDYFTPAEQAAVAASPEPNLTCNLIWSAKESALKVLRTGLRSDTRTVEVAYETDDDSTWAPLSVTNHDGRRFPGWWLRSGEFILTCATELAAGPPLSLVHPHGLTAATPSHRWMSDFTME